MRVTRIENEEEVSLLVSLVPKIEGKVEEDRKLEVLGEVGKFFDDEKACWWLGDGDFIVFQDPRLIVRHEDRIEADGERRIDIRLGAVADHPRRAGGQGIFGYDREIGGCVFFGNNLDRGKIVLQAGAFDLAGLLRESALGDDDEMVAL